MPDELDVIIECENAGDTDYEGIIYLKCTSWTAMLTRDVKLYDLGLLKVLMDALAIEKPLPAFATDFGKTTETYELNFELREDSVLTSEERLMIIMDFVRTKSAFAKQCYLYIGANINDDGSRMIEFSGKGIIGKINTFEVISRSKENHIKCRIKFIHAIDLLNWGT